MVSRRETIKGSALAWGCFCFKFLVKILINKTLLQIFLIVKSGSEKRLPMSFVPAIRDYIEMLNNVFDSLSGNINSQIIIKETLVYLFVSIKCIFTYLFSFQWLQNVSYFPILVPQLHSSVLNETYFLHNPVSTIFTFLETPTYGSNKLVLGFLNSFFFCLPISCAHIICARRLLIQGLPAGIASGLGTILGQWWFATCILFGLRSFIIPWFSFEPLNFIIGFCLLLNIIHEMTHQRSFNIINTKNKTKLVRIFLLNLILSWTEQSCFFQYFGNLTFGPEPSALEIFSSNTEIQSFLIDGSYLLGLLAGSFLFTGLFGFISIRLSNFIYPLFKYTLSRWINLLNFGLISLTIAFTLTLIPFYGLDYLFAGPLGFISQDKALDKTFFSLNTVENTKRILLAESQTNSFNTDLNSFDRGSYLNSPEFSRMRENFAFEDLNYRGEYAWTSRTDRQPVLYRQENRLTDFFKYLFGRSDKRKISTSNKNEGLLRNTTKNYQLKSDKKDENLRSKNLVKNDDQEESSSDNNVNTAYLTDEEESSSDNNNNTDYLTDGENVLVKKGLVGLKKRFAEEEEYFDTIAIDDIIDTSNCFSSEFVSDDPQYDRRLEQKIKQNYYSNPIYKSLLSFDIDSFLSKQPTFQKLTLSEEKNLFKKRILLSSYYDSLRYYNQLPYIEEFQDFFDGSKSYADRVFNQQFKGTLKIVRRLFSITVDPEENTNENPVLKFDQPLYLNSNESDYKPFHEELSHKKVQKTHFLEISNSTPFYAGWDQGLRKLVITNRLLPRSFAGYALYSPTKIKGQEYRTLANFIDSNKKIEFTTWPLSKLTLEKEPKSLSSIPYNVLFKSLKDPQNQHLATAYPFFFELETDDPLETFPSNLVGTPGETEIINDVIPPNKGGFIWPGNSPLKFNLISKFKRF